MDIKPGNIFICRESMDDCSVHHDSDDGFDELDDDYGSVTYKIGDLGQSKEINEEFLTTFVGTKCYFSPEMITKQVYTAKTDVW